MVCSRFLLVLLAGVVCSFCNNDFVSLGRHAWHCEHRITQAERPSAGVDEDANESDVGDPLMAPGVPFAQPEDHCFRDIKKGINLPKSEEQWLTANEYLKSVLSLNPPITVQNLSSRVKLLNDTVYD